MESPEPSLLKAISPEVLNQISGRELLIEHLDHWPTFDDFEVLSMTLERPLISTASHDLKAAFLVFDLNKAPGDPDRKQASAELLFESILKLRIDGFNHQNPISGLSIEPCDSGLPGVGLRVKWGGTCMRHDVSFICGRIAVVRVVDLNPFRKSLQII